ncbi:hypothetical protein RED65_12194 [Oceanobacter sp. RED65]|uniref:Uncharacterized protein n=2 Tax=Bermanella marisrubri TaxID=207949 RepID=Q1N3P4_9GAMM|nr:hypothetical protein RED65_12194 [Oceanobacter sp. RED65] [Bermanella marisrubri]
MFSLSEGDQRYQQQYQQHFQAASEYLDELTEFDTMLAGELRPLWQDLKGKLKYEVIPGAGYTMSTRTRVEFRDYLTLLYTKVHQQVSSESQLHNELYLMAIDVEMMTARFFDISSSEYGVMGLSASQRAIDPLRMANAFNRQLRKLEKMGIPRNLKRQLERVETKWRFIEDSVVNYKDEAAFLTVFFNKKQIGKILTESTDLIAAT